MASKKKENEKPPQEPDEIPATEGSLGAQGGTSQPGPPTEDAPRNIDFATGEADS